MREFLAVCLVLASIALLMLSLVALVRPIPKLKLGNRTRALGGIGLSFALFLTAAGVAPPVDEAAHPASNSNEQEKAEKSLSDAERELANLDRTITEVNITPATKYVSIKVDMRQSWSAKHIPTQAAMSVERVGKAIKEGDVEFPVEIERVNFWFTYPMIDRYGNESRAQILNLTFKTEDLRKVNYGNLPQQGLLDLAYDISFGGRHGREAAAEYCADDGKWSPAFCQEVMDGLQY